MSEIKKIYKVYDGKVNSVDVEKETEKLLWVSRPKEFGYVKTLDRAHVCVTPQEAVLEEFNRALTLHGAAEDRLNYAQNKLKDAIMLRHLYNI